LGLYFILFTSSHINARLNQI